MADELDVQPVAEVTPEPAADAALERSSQFLERSMERMGVSIEDIPEAEPQQPEPFGESQADAARRLEIHAGARARIERQREERERAAERRALEGLFQQLEELKSRVPQPAPTDDGPKPPDESLFDEDPQAWYRAQAAYEREMTVRSIREMVQPVVDSTRQANESQQQYQQRLYQERQEQAGRQHHIRMVDEDEAAYVPEPAAREAYSARVQWLRDSRTQEFIAGGIPLADARAAADKELRDIVAYAAQIGQNTAAVVDQVAQARIRTAMSFATQAGYRFTREEAQPQSETSSARQIAASAARGGATAPAAQAARQPRAASLAARAQTMSTEDLKKEILRHGPDAQAKVKELLAAGNARYRKAG